MYWKDFQNELDAKSGQEAVVLFLYSEYTILGKEVSVCLAQST